MKTTTKQWLGNPLRVFLYITIPALAATIVTNIDLLDLDPTEKFIVITIAAPLASLVYNRPGADHDE